jgi:hypothetical protein
LFCRSKVHALTSSSSASPLIALAVPPCRGSEEVAPGEFSVDIFSGTLGPFGIDASRNPPLAPGSVAGISGTNDNLLFSPENPASFSLGGLAFGLLPSQGFPSVDLACNGSNSSCALLYGGMTHPASVSVVGPFGIPGPTIGAGLPGLIAACGGLLIWWRRKRRAQPVV